MSINRVEYKLIVDIEETHGDWTATVVCVRHTERTAEARIVPPRGSQLWIRAVERAQRNYLKDMLITMDTPWWHREVQGWWEDSSPPVENRVKSKYGTCSGSENGEHEWSGREGMRGSCRNCPAIHDEILGDDCDQRYNR